MLKASSLILVTLLALPCSAQIVVDGSGAGDKSYYTNPLSVQNTNTGYGNATNGDPRYANGGSEIDQVFAKVLGGRLFVLISGNLESNFNKLNVFIDSAPGGMNQINGSQLPAQVDPYCCGVGGGALQNLNGFRFDTAFEADYFLTFSNGNHTFGAGINIWTLSAYYADLTNGVSGDKSEIGFQRNASGVEPGFPTGEPIDQVKNGCTSPSDTNCMPPEHEFAEPVDLVNDPTNTRNHRGFLNDIGLQMAINNSNAAGVNSGSGGATGTPFNVQTGIEFSVPLTVIGNPTAAIKIAAYIGNGSHSNVSNQFAGVGVLRGNLGSPSSVNLASIAGDQFVTVPMPPSADFDDDGDIDGQDFLAWQRGNGDADGNGTSDATDLAIWQQQYGSSGILSAATSVPEPAAAAALLFLLATSGSRRFTLDQPHAQSRGGL